MYASVCRRLADDPVVHELGRGRDWRFPLALLAGLHYLALAEGLDPWADPATTTAERRAWLSEFVETQPVQTNEVQRSWMLLPCFLELARRSGIDVFDVVELGSSAGLNLVWDRYRYAYSAGSWGPADAPLELGGEERRPVPGGLLALAPRVRERVGIEQQPIDVTTDEGARLLKCFVWADRPERLERLDRAIDVLRADPPELVRGDLVELLPGVLDRRRTDALTVVFETAVLGYLPPERRDQVWAALEAAAPLGPLAVVRTSEPPDGAHTHYGMWLRLWPDERECVALAHFHGAWVEWLP